MNEKARKYRRLPVILLSLAVVTLGAGSLAVVRGILSGAPVQPKKVVQEIKVIRPPPPPPDVPPPPPPPPEEKVDIPDPQKQEPDPTPSNDPPPSENLGLDAEGTAGGDQFGLVGNKGGRELIASGGNAVNWYAGVIRDRVREALDENAETRSGSYTADVTISYREDGTIDQVHLMRSTGNPARDRAIESVVMAIGRLPQAPPSGMPLRETLRLVRHG